MTWLAALEADGLYAAIRQATGNCRAGDTTPMTKSVFKQRYDLFDRQWKIFVENENCKRFVHLGQSVSKSSALVGHRLDFGGHASSGRSLVVMRILLQNRSIG